MRCVIVFRPLEYDGAALERVRVFRIHQIAVAEFLRNHAGLHDRGIEEVAAQHEEACVLHQRLVVTPDHVAIGLRRLAAIIAHGMAVDGDERLRECGLAFINSRTTEGTPPARWNSSPR